VNAGWLAAIAAVIVAIPVAARMTQQMVSATSPWKRQKRRELAWTRMAEYLANECSHSRGYPRPVRQTPGALPRRSAVAGRLGN